MRVPLQLKFKQLTSPGTEPLVSASEPMVVRILIFLLLLTSTKLIAQVDTSHVSHTLYLVGDAGELDIINQPLGNVLREKVSQSVSRTTVIYLGDNIYPKGMPDPNSRNRAVAERILRTQVGWIQGLDARGIFIPGNHDWQRGNKKGYAYIKNQQQWLDSLKDDNISLLPRDGCPGPVEVPLTDKSTLVILDTQWLLHPWDKPETDGNCDAKSPADLLVLLNDVLNRNGGKRIIVVGHHPLITYGEHGGFFQFKDHIFPLTHLKSNLYVPLPLIGSIYPLYRKWFGNIQDVTHPQYKEMSVVFRNLLADHPGTIYASGHEHNLQYLVKDSTHFIVSGSGSKTTYVREKRLTSYADAAQGFVKVGIRDDGSAKIEFWRVDESFPSGIKTFEAELPVLPVKRVDQPLLNDTSVVTLKTKASAQYHASKMRMALLGKNYRAAWAQELEVPVFNIAKEKGGLKAVQKGGGMQTLSLRLEDSAGRQFVLRSVEKFPEKAVPEMLRNTFAEDLVQDQISASHPYAAVLIPPLADAAGIYHTNPKIVFIPNDHRLGIYRRDFSNTLALFEERPSGNWVDAAYFGYSSDIINTGKVLEAVFRDNICKVDQAFTLRSRLFDMWIGDWDRHDDQWRWAGVKSGDSILFRPIPRDRDQAFFVNEGFFPRLWSRRWSLPQFEGFSNVIKWPSGLAYSARYFDRSFLTELSKDDWLESAKSLQQKLTDEVIDSSVKGWPEELFKLDGEDIIRKLKARKSRLVTDALHHYAFLAKSVDVVGSDKSELFLVDRLPEGDVHVKSYNINDSPARLEAPFYDRVFKRSETREIRLYTMGGNDRVEVSGSSAKSILLRVIGGDGVDSLIDISNVKGLKNNTLFYDLKNGNAMVGQEAGDRRATDPTVNLYDRKAFKYNKLSPLIFGSFNPDDGLIAGVGMLYQTEGFRVTPFKQRHTAVLTSAFGTSSYNFTYRGEFNDVVGHWGMELNTDIKAPRYVNNFFGLGNESEFDKDIDEKPGYNVEHSIDYYRYRFDELKLEILITRRVGEWGVLKAGPVIQTLGVQRESEKDRFVNEFASGLPYDLFDNNTYAGASWKFTIDKRDNTRLTTRGVVFNVGGKNFAHLDAGIGDFSSYEGSVSFYHSFRFPARVVFAARAGGGINTGDFQFFQAQILNGLTELRGFRRTRFYGDRKFYSNVEMRLKLFSLRTYLFPASLGILAFHDVGRVWYKDDNNIDPTSSTGKSHKWHTGWGGGLWFTPFNLTILSIEAGHSPEGTLGYVRLGFLF